MYIDTHTHLNFQSFGSDWQSAVKEAKAAGVEKMIVVGTDIKSSLKAIEMVKQDDSLLATVGFHPHHVRSFLGLSYARVQLAQITDQLAKLAKTKRVVGIGECGLDYHVYKQTKYKTVLKKEDWKKFKILQKQVFGMQIQLAKKLNLPLVIHNREAENDLIDTIDHFCKEDGKYPNGVLHCISGSKEYLKKGLKMGFYIGVDGNVTYDKKVQKLAKEVPLNRLVIETDSPNLIPEPIKSSQKTSRNKPANVVIVAEFLSKLKKVEIKKIQEATRKNAKDLFKI